MFKEANTKNQKIRTIFSKINVLLTYKRSYEQTNCAERAFDKAIIIREQKATEQEVTLVINSININFSDEIIVWNVLSTITLLISQWRSNSISSSALRQTFVFKIFTCMGKILNFSKSHNLYRGAEPRKLRFFQITKLMYKERLNNFPSPKAYILGERSKFFQVPEPIYLEGGRKAWIFCVFQDHT